MQDIMLCVKRHEKLQCEFTKYRNKYGAPRRHSKEFLVALALDVRRNIEALQAEQEDEYQSVGAALVNWRNYYNDILLELNKK